MAFLGAHPATIGPGATPYVEHEYIRPPKIKPTPMGKIRPVSYFIKSDPISVLPTVRDGRPIKTIAQQVKQLPKVEEGQPWKWLSVTTGGAAGGSRGVMVKVPEDYSSGVRRRVPQPSPWWTTMSYEEAKRKGKLDQSGPIDKVIGFFTGKGRGAETEVATPKQPYGRYISAMAREKRGAWEERPMSRADYYGDEVREVTPRTVDKSFGFRQLMPFKVPGERDPVMAADASPFDRPMVPEVSKRRGLLMANEVPTEVDMVETVQRRRMRPRVSPARMPGGIAEFLQNLFSGIFGRRPKVASEEVSPWVQELGPVPMVQPFGY